MGEKIGPAYKGLECLNMGAPDECFEEVVSLKTSGDRI